MAYIEIPKKQGKSELAAVIDGAVATIMVLDRAIRCGTVTVLRSTMTAGFCLYNFRINSLKSAILLRELPLSSLTLPLFSAII